MHNFVPRKDSEVSPPLRKKGFGCDLRVVAIVLLMAALSPAAWAQVTLNMGDILVADALGQSVIAINGSDGAQQTVLTSGNLLQQAVGVGFLPDGYLVVADRINGLIRVNPATGVQELLSSLGSCSDPFAVTVALDADANAWVWVADSGYDVSTGRRCQNSNGVATGPNYAGRVIKVDPTTKKQYVMATGAACTSIPADGSACLNTSSVGSYITHPYGIAFDSRTGTIVVSDMSSFNGQGAIIRIDQTTGVQSLIWGPASEAKVFKDPSSTPLGCPMGITAEPNGNILATAFTYPTTGQIQYGCSNPGIYRVDLLSPTPNAYTLSSSAVGWKIPFGIDTDADSSGGTRDIVVADEGWKALYRVDPTKPDSFYSPPPFAQLPPGRQPVGIAIIKFVPKGGFLSAAPVVNITGAPSSSIPEGTAVNLMSIVNPPGSYTYAWTVTKNGNPFATGS